MSAAFSGVVTSLVTPFKSSFDADFGRSSTVDTFRVASLTRWQARSGVAAVAVAGWAGEGSTLEQAERIALIEATASAKGRMSVLAHVGTPSTARSIALALDAEAAGADGLVLVMPFYNKPSFSGVRAHVEAVAAATRLPLFLEFDEAATKVQLSSCQMAELTRVANVAAIVDHSANPLHVECMTRARHGVAFLAGHEPTAAATGLLGADGLFSAVANVAPTLVVGLWDAIRGNDGALAREFQSRLRPLVDLVEAEGVAALKDLLHESVGCETTVRLPLHTLGRAAQRQAASVRDAIEAVPPRGPVRPAVAAGAAR
ncbi:dihydrodipicolinate synthase family protein [Aureimonas jatrophae]|uniref:4-hydroxy-tetrahydrodipicolinate synthase n=1 Tax=Aureimonas jatrophae TaxID=1166073 RepID=A0A1H0HYN9_9HYPH|nr:dihydrodipicolinate synthase family protein [Aureimonas jatrophae]MBB3950847.1 4-hydroxy-tetrahydrodipicolinate synthase [Aureimonas jatrophae]SDO24244.1 4-hydroxy-tetrahydrodipicolinate synthase [Aureimonas jatrophae]